MERSQYSVFFAHNRSLGHVWYLSCCGRLVARGRADDELTAHAAAWAVRRLMECG